jgi:serine/threonine protein kinase
MNYTLKSKLGEGGMATVFLAQDPKFQADVAIKILKKEFIHNEHIRKRFISEARSMFRMSHPNVIKVTDLIVEEDTVAFVMEYVEGETLKEYLERKGKLTDTEIREIFSQMLDAVGYVHEQKLVHRDIKPSNFMLDKKGKVKLMDFGIAKNTDANEAEYTQTGTGMQIGTPMYMSPEQITETKSVTPQSDIYSLGVVLWQMVTGKKPYDTKTLSNFQLLTKIITEKLADTKTAWDSIIHLATAKERENRYKSCTELKLEVPLTSKVFEEESTQIEEKKTKVAREESLVKDQKNKNESNQKKSIENQLDLESSNSKRKYNIAIYSGIAAFVILGLLFLFVLGKSNEDKENEINSLKSDSIAAVNPAMDIANIEAYLAKYNRRAKKTKSGLYYIIEENGKGDEIIPGTTVYVNYGMYNLITGALLDTTWPEVAKVNNMFNEERSYGPISFNVGMGQMIPGFEEGLMLLKRGSKGQLLIPSSLSGGWGLVMVNIEVIDVKRSEGN